MQLTLRAKVLIAVALAVGAFVIFNPSGGNTVAPAEHTRTAEHARGAAAAPRASMQRELDLAVNRVADAASAARLFATHSWLPPPPPPPPPAAPVVQAPVAPTAPPLPFAYMGSYLADGGQAVYFVTRDNRIYDLKAGDIIDDVYSFDGLNANQLVFTYKPLKIQQTLAMGTHE
jgi:hypothetical protein